MELYNAAVEMFIRPPRAKYEVKDLGPKSFNVGPRSFFREDLECQYYDQVRNSRGFRLQCSHFQPVKEQRLNQKLPCVIYLHGNCGCRLDAIELAPLLLTQNITLFCFDFTGSGLSEGEYISLGFYEQNDVEAVVGYLQDTKMVKNIALWGVSMGAATSIMYTATHPTSITCLILDSPFSSLMRVAQEVIDQQQTSVPKFLFNGVANVGLSFVRKSIKKKARFDIKKNEPLVYVEKCRVPVLFAHADSDTVIDQQHSMDLFEKYGGEKKKFLGFAGNHNTPRPVTFFDQASRFLHAHLLTDVDRQRVPQPSQVFDNTVATKNAVCFMCKRVPEVETEIINLVECHVILALSLQGCRLLSAWTERLQESLRWHEITVYFVLENHFCLDWKKGKHSGRIVLFTIEAKRIVQAFQDIIPEVMRLKRERLAGNTAASDALQDNLVESQIVDAKGNLTIMNDKSSDGENTSVNAKETPPPSSDSAPTQENRKKSKKHRTRHHHHQHHHKHKDPKPPEASVSSSPTPVSPIVEDSSPPTGTHRKKVKDDPVKDS